MVGIFVDGVVVKFMGSEIFCLCNQYIDEVMIVINDEICVVIKDIFDDICVIVEFVGVMLIVVICKYVNEYNIFGQKLGGILCGVNINFYMLCYVLEWCELGE